MEQGGVRVPEDGDELVRVDLRFDRAERRVAALVCERGAHCRRRGGAGAGAGGEEREQEKEKNASGESAAERCCGRYCTLHETDIAVNPREREFPLARGD